MKMISYNVTNTTINRNWRTKKLVAMEEQYKTAKLQLDHIPSTMNKEDVENIIFSSFFFEIQNILND